MTTFALQTTPLGSCKNFDIADLVLVEEIGASKATVFLGYLASSQMPVAVKVYPHRQRRVSTSFLNEASFAHLCHPNITQVAYTSPKYTLAISEGVNVNTSIIVMQLAPNGDFLNLLITNQIKLDARLARTYFHQLVSAMEYMHTNGVAHQDLKLDNLLLDEDFQLKICDFDVAWKEGDVISNNVGTLNYRAPEICNKVCSDAKKTDIYSAGILLFLFKCGGVLPHLEDQLFDGANLRDLLHNNTDAFWQKHCHIQKKRTAFFDNDFKQLFTAMVHPDPEKRCTIEQIKESKWYQGETYSQSEVTLIMERLSRKVAK